MTKLEQAAQQTLEALKYYRAKRQPTTRFQEEVAALEAALNARVPVGYITVWGPDKVQFTECVGAKLADLEEKVFPVYIEPPQRQPLSLDQISMIFNRVYPAQPLSQNVINLVQEVEKHHEIR